MSQIFLRFWRKSPDSFASSEGLVVTPSRMPSCAMASISLMLPVSTKIFMVELLLAISYRLSALRLHGIGQLADALDLDGDRIAVAQRADARRCAGRDDVA